MNVHDDPDDIEYLAGENMLSAVKEKIGLG